MVRGNRCLKTYRSFSQYADGAQNQLFRDFVKSAGVTFELPFHGNFADDYSIIAFAGGYEQAGFQPVPVGPNASSQLDLMLLPKNGTFHFAGGRWRDLVARKSLVAGICRKCDRRSQ